MKQHAKKKKRSSQSQAPKKVSDRRSDEDEKKTKAIRALTEAFASASIDDVVSAFDEAGGDLDRAVAILGLALSESSDDPWTSSTSGEGSGSSSSSGAGSSEGFVETSFVENLINEDCRRSKQKQKQKRVVASTGTVSTVLGREYMVPSPRKTNMKGFDIGVAGKDKAEQFLCSMLGDESELNLAIVRDVLCQCGYDVEKALDALLVLSASSNEQSMDHTNYSLSYKHDTRYHVENWENPTDGVFDCSFHSSECELHDSIWSVGCSCRKNYAEVLASSEPHYPTDPRSTGTHLPQKVLESFFQVSKSTEHKPSTMNWRNVVKKLQLLGPHFNVCPSNQSEGQQDIFAKGDEYHAFRKIANQQWVSAKSCYAKAATAYSKGAKEYAAYLSDQGQLKTKLAREADEKASKDIFKARNQDIQNVITIDLHGQHVKQAMRVLKMHLLFVSYVQTVQTLRVITGCGTHGMGKSKLKQSVIKLLENEGIKWREENQGTVLIKLCGQREFSFMDSASDDE